VRKRYRISLVSLPLIDLWERRSLILHFSWLNLKIKYKGSYLGLLWIALEPALIFTLLYTVFTSIKFATEENFGIYLLSGIIVYNIFNKGTMGGLSSIRANSGILKSLNIPKEFFPVTSTVSSSIIMIIQIGVFFLLMPFFWIHSIMDNCVSATLISSVTYFDFRFILLTFDGKCFC